jgi:hypothetical protein
VALLLALKELRRPLAAACFNLYLPIVTETDAMAPGVRPRRRVAAAECGRESGLVTSDTMHHAPCIWARCGRGGGEDSLVNVQSVRVRAFLPWRPGDARRCAPPPSPPLLVRRSYYRCT